MGPWILALFPHILYICTFTLFFSPYELCQLFVVRSTRVLARVVWMWGGCQKIKKLDTVTQINRNSLTCTRIHKHPRPRRWCPNMRPPLKYFYTAWTQGMMEIFAPPAQSRSAAAALHVPVLLN